MPVYEVFINGKPRRIELTKAGEDSFNVKIDNKTYIVETPSDKFDLEKGFSIKIDGKTYQITLPKIAQEKVFSVKVEEVTFKAEVKIPTKRPLLTALEPTRLMPTRRVGIAKQVVEGAVVAPMTGKISSVKVKRGDQVKAGKVLCILEAMKMENEIAAPKTGIIREVYVSEGSSVSEGDVLFVID